MMPDDYNYTPLDNYMLGVCADDSLTYQQKCIRVYKAMPVTDEEWDRSKIFGVAENDPNAGVIKLYADILDNAQYYVPVDMIISKYREIIEANPIDISEVADLRRIGPRGEADDGDYIFIKNEWPQFNYLDDRIAMPDFPNMFWSQNPERKAPPERQREFINELRCQSDDYILNFMMIAFIPPNAGIRGAYEMKPHIAGENTIKFDNSDSDDSIIYASFEQIYDFPQWYRAWNLLVPTMCQRNEGSMLEALGDFPQRACGNLIEDEKYRMPLARYRELKAKNLIEKDDE